MKLFKEDSDKIKYLKMVKDYEIMYGFKIYAYCLMPNHGHFILDTQGADISKIMHGLNFKYANYYNKKYKRYGHLFQDRFKSKPVCDDEYLKTLSAYIHNNPAVLRGYEEKPYKYKFSSLKVYMGKAKDEFNILDEEYILKILGENKYEAMLLYLKNVQHIDTKNCKDQFDFLEEGTQYKSSKVPVLRNISPEAVMEYAAEITGVSKSISLHFKNRRENTKARALAAVIMRCLCNYKCSDICRELGNITSARVSMLCTKGLELLKNEQYNESITKFIEINSYNTD